MVPVMVLVPVVQALGKVGETEHVDRKNRNVELVIAFRTNRYSSPQGRKKIALLKWCKARKLLVGEHGVMRSMGEE
jgi:hypothetical protein